MGADNRTGLTTALKQAAHYQAPEIICASAEDPPQTKEADPSGRFTTVKGDIYAFGLTALEVLLFH